MRKPFWFFMNIGWCPVCNRDASYKEYRTDPKPLKWEDRHSYMSDMETYCGCEP